MESCYCRKEASTFLSDSLDFAVTSKKLPLKCPRSCINLENRESYQESLYFRVLRQGWINTKQNYSNVRTALYNTAILVL